MISAAEIEKIILHAIHAPSGDNSQPWEFQIQPPNLIVTPRVDKDHPILNVEGRGTYIAIGALLENIIITASEYGFSTVIEMPNTSDAIRVAFNQTPSASHPHFHAIPARHTHRGAYHTSISDNLLERITADNTSSCKIVIIRDQKQVQRLAAAASVMEEVALKTKKLHSIFFNTLLWDAALHAQGASGLYVKTMELPAPILALFRIIRRWSIMRLFNAIGFATLASKSNAAVYAQSGAILGFIPTATSREAYIDAGRCMQRAWLKITHEGLAAQPLAGLLYLAEYVARTKDTDIAPHLQSRILKARLEMQTILGTTEPIAMMLRIGTPVRNASDRARRARPVIHS